MDGLVGISGSVHPDRSACRSAAMGEEDRRLARPGRRIALPEPFFSHVAQRYELRADWADGRTQIP